MKKLIVLLLVSLSLLVACSNEEKAEGNINQSTVEHQDLPQPGDKDFVGPLEKDDWENHKDEFNK